MKSLRQIVLVYTLVYAAAISGYATVLVSNVWNTGVRTYPTPADANSSYSEMGVDWNASGDFESAWFNANGTLTASTGHLLGIMPASGTSSASWTTYFTPESSPVTLSGAGDQLKVTWVFTPTGVNVTNASQAFPIAVVDSPSGSRLTGEGSPGSAVYTGYGVFMNMGQTLGNNHPFQLVERTNASGAFLSSSSPEWIGRADGATSGNHGYDNGTQYTFIMTVTRNASDELEIVATMTGGTLNGTGVASASYTDTTPNGNSYSFDTFGVRPNRADRTATGFNTTLFKVEFIAGAASPSIDIDPQGQTVLVGQDATFNVLASGTLPLGYQWYYNTNTPLTAYTNSTLTLTNVQLTNSGGYSVVVSNAYGSVTSAVAQLTVNVPVAPSIITQPQDQTSILPGATVTFSVVAGGSEPLSCQWYFNTNTSLANASDAILTLTNVQVVNAGTYMVVVTNLAGSATSTNAILMLNTNPVAPSFISQPASQIAVVGSTVSFSAQAAGTAPISYQWNRNGTPIAGATSTTLTLTNVQTTNAGSYTLTASNSVGSVTSDAAVLTVTTSVSVPWSAYNLTGFGRATTGGGVIPESDSAYKKVYTALDFANAIRSANKTAGAVKVIEIMNDLDLGWSEVGTNVQSLDSNPFRAHTGTVKLHPRLLVTGVSLIDIKSKNGLTIFSANGATIRHATLNIKSTGNIIVRNLKFDEMWEWDEASKGDYDKNDWDFIDLGNAGTVSNIWIDHCTFTKAYDGITDIKGGSFNITFSWCKYTGDDGATNTNSWVWQQINSLESNKTAYAMYNSLRSSSGFSTTNIVTIVQGHDKTHLMGANSLEAENAQLSATFHHQWFINTWDRLPRLRAGNVHCYNIYVDDTLAWAAKQLRNQHTVSSTYNFNPPLNGSISTETGAVQVVKSVYLKCLWPLRDNQTDSADTNYTGKIIALDTIYLNPTDNTLTRGNSTDPGSKLGPFQAQKHLPFSWNLPGNQLPYTYTADDPAQLEAIVTSPTAGAGAGVLTWNKTNWLVTSYSASAPVIVADPQGQTVAAGGSATFTVVASGSAPLSYQWYFNTNTPLANATNTSLTLTNLQTTNTGTYHVVVTNVAGSATSVYALLTVTAANTAPALNPVPDTNIIAGVTLNITNAATDSDLPPQTLTFSLLSGPNNAVLTQINNTNATFNWRPLVAEAGTTNLITVRVADNGTPILSATQSFHVIVSAPAQPEIPSVTFSNGQFSLTITGDTGPDYIVQVSTNLTDWAGVYTNPMPFTWTDTGASNFSQQFYRIQLGP
jgi:pectate lyase